MKSLQEHLTELLESPTSKQKTPCVYNGRTVTYRPGLYGSEWAEFAKSQNYDEKYNEATFAFDYDENTLVVECPNWRGTRMAHYAFRLRNSSFDEYNAKNKDIYPQDFNHLMSGRADITQMLDVLNIACWTFNNSPEPLFENKNLHEYGEVPKHLEQAGMTQELFYDWNDGGESFDKAEAIVNKYLASKYGSTKAKKIIKKYEYDGSKAFFDIVTEEPGYEKYIDAL